MKKIITMVLVGLMVLSSSIAVFAEEPEDTLLGAPLMEEQIIETNILRLGRAKEFTEELHQINALRIERNQLQIQVIEKQDQLVDLYIEARENGDREALAAAKAEREKIKDIHDEITALHEQSKEARKAFREALKNEDKDTAEAELEKIIEIFSTINDKIKDKIEVLDTIIDILS